MFASPGDESTRPAVGHSKPFRHGEAGANRLSDGTWQDLDSVAEVGGVYARVEAQDLHDR